MKKTLVISLLLSIAVFAAACGSTDTAGSGPAATGKEIKSGTAGNNLTATLSSRDGVLRKGKQTVTLKFADQSGKPVDVGAASLNFHMPAMGTMAVMNNAATLTTTGTPGIYSGSVDLEMSGEWQAQISYQGPAGNGKANIPVTAQ
ncbi:MAG TPA: FixH family protein [Pyrinomonadaceae bacterium]|jgi:nitrogen fixation protein FixH|nr:FixH family protein [Pyrinomonadaceae bacterium]